MRYNLALFALLDFKQLLKDSSLLILQLKIFIESILNV